MRQASAAVTSRNSASGCEVKRCFRCFRSTEDTKRSIQNGLRLVRVRYGLPYSELPDLEPCQLSIYLSFLLLQGQERASVVFPRRQCQPDDEGLCSLQRLRRHERWELAQTIASFKRNLPTSCGLHSPSAREPWEANAFSNPTPVSSEFLAFVKAKVSALFRPGWDRSYRRFCRSHVPQASQRLGGIRSDHYWAGREEEFDTQSTEETDLPSVLFAEYVEVPSAGKLRPLLVFGPEIDLLAGLHKTVYDHLDKRTDWLLRGPPTAERIKSTCVYAEQTSVDLVSATDGLYHETARAILDALFFQSVSVPRSVRRLAYASLSPYVIDKKGVITGKVTHGQMMGAYLSFPLLCLQSWLAASWAARSSGDYRMLVNGDDCVVSSQLPLGAYPHGFVLNDKKTIRCRDVVEVNSTTFLRKTGGWREIRHLRRGAFLSDWHGLHHAASAVSISVAWTAAFVRCRFGQKWGFLPSQIGLRSDSYPAWCRQVTMSRRRIHTDLPGDPRIVDDSLCPLPKGEEWDDRARSALRSHLFAHGRKVKKKRFGQDWCPRHIGQVRRTYGYRRVAPWSYLTFRPGDRWAWSSPGTKEKIHGFVPTDFVTTSEFERLCALKRMREDMETFMVSTGPGIWVLR